MQLDKKSLDSRYTLVVMSVMLARQVTPLTHFSNTLTPFLRYSSKLLRVSRIANSFAIKQIQTLRAKHPGYGVPRRSSAYSASQRYHFSSSGSRFVCSGCRIHHRFLTRLFSLSSESLFSQVPSFHNLLRCPRLFSQRSFFPPLLLSLLVIALSPYGLSAQSVPFGHWSRASESPLISPQGAGWESGGTFNPAVVLHNGKFVMLYRAQDAAGTSRLGYAESTDGIHFTRRPQPVLSPEANYEKDGGVEDPRLQNFGGTYYLTYTGYNKKDAQLCLAISRDLIHWDRKGVILPAYKGNWNKGWTKSGAIVPQQINGKYWMYWLGTSADKTDQMGISYSTDLLHWTEATETPVLPRRPGKFDSRVVEPGPPPILTETGVVLIYNGADDKLVYRTGVAVFDRRDPRKLLSRTEEPIFTPEKGWEKVGQVPNVVFVEGMARRGDRWLFYYGGADKYVGVAEALVQ